MNTLLGFPEGGSTLPFGRILRQWRGARHLGQLALATEAGISTRHLSFLETGRAQPSREITLFATARDVALQQLKIECFFPADAATEQTARRLAAAAPQLVASR